MEVERKSTKDFKTDCHDGWVSPSALKSERSSWRDRSLYNSEWYNEIAKKCSGFCQNPTVKPCLSAGSSRENASSTEKSLAILWDLLSSLVRRCRPVPPASLWADDYVMVMEHTETLRTAVNAACQHLARWTSGDRRTQNSSLSYDQLYLQPFRLVKKFKCTFKESLDTMWMMICSIMGGFRAPHHGCSKLFISISSICRDYWAKQK